MRTRPATRITGLAALVLGVLAQQAAAFAPMHVVGKAKGEWCSVCFEYRGIASARDVRGLRGESAKLTVPLYTRNYDTAGPTAAVAAAARPHTALFTAVQPDDLVIAPGGANDDVRFASPD